MTSTIARLSFISISLLTIGLSLWKSSELNHAVYLTMENYVGGSSTLHFTFSMLIGFLAVFTFLALPAQPKWMRSGFDCCFAYC